MFMLVINSVCEGSRLALLFFLSFLHDGVNITGVICVSLFAQKTVGTVFRKCFWGFFLFCFVILC